MTRFLRTLKVGTRFTVPGTTITGRVVSKTPGAVTVEVREPSKPFAAREPDGRQVTVNLGTQTRRTTVSPGTLVEVLP